MDNLGKTFALVLVVLFLIPIVTLQQTTIAQPSNITISAPATEWQKDYGQADLNRGMGIESASNLIQTNDGGYAFLDLGWGYQTHFKPSTLYKVDSSGNVQWNKTIEVFSASTIIQTSDRGYEISGGWNTYGTTYEFTPTLIKTDSQGNIQWVQNYTSVPDLGIASSRIQTSDGGFAYWKGGIITKTDSNNNKQWIKNVTYPIDEPILTYPLALSSLIETSDGALAGLGVGDYILSNSRTGKIYLVKTEAFLPLPSPTQLPTPILTPIPTPTPTIAMQTNSNTIFIALVLIIAVIVGLLLYRRHRKTTKPKQ
jgi:hypothetical protein